MENPLEKQVLLDMPRVYLTECQTSCGAITEGTADEGWQESPIRSGGRQPTR